ncbi:hypothetical protein IF1G_08483 [Cordyceps javanica]|uniref:Uncharacterized protein n=1 Tax=Cordyceps javanica TaxID=43265 RepID=A0A545USV7_9HYPO|nr:hypothetical protein IF1G_08483 [Cordyceps javanica]
MFPTQNQSGNRSQRAMSCFVSRGNSRRLATGSNRRSPQFRSKTAHSAKVLPRLNQSLSTPITDRSLSSGKMFKRYVEGIEGFLNCPIALFTGISSFARAARPSFATAAPRRAIRPASIRFPLNSRFASTAGVGDGKIYQVRTGPMYRAGTLS